MESKTDEAMLAQEQGVRMRKSGERQELEGGLGGELEGTLVLTNHRLIFVSTNEKEDSLRGMRLVYSDVEELTSIPKTGSNFFIPLQSITSVKGHFGRLERPSLEVKWRDGVEEGRVFVERLSGRSRRRNLNDWALVIERLKAGNQKFIQLPKAPAADTLDGRIMIILADMQRKGTFEVEQEAENRFNVQLDPDDVEAACKRLARTGLIEEIPDTSGDVYYRKRSPLGDDTL